ncbi:ferritin-like domain-containing protein, partial [Campylobacter coli]
MQKEFFNELEKILYEQNLDNKFENFAIFYDDFKSQKFIFN